MIKPEKNDIIFVITASQVIDFDEQPRLSHRNFLTLPEPAPNRTISFQEQCENLNLNEFFCLKMSIY